MHAPRHALRPASPHRYRYINLSPPPLKAVYFEVIFHLKLFSKPKRNIGPFSSEKKKKRAVIEPAASATKIKLKPSQLRRTNSDISEDAVAVTSSTSKKKSQARFRKQTMRSEISSSSSLTQQSFIVVSSREESFEETSKKKNEKNEKKNEKIDVKKKENERCRYEI